jgi:hypothetical protein
VAVQQRAAQAGQRLSFGAGPRRFHPPPRRQVDKRTHDPGDGNKDDQGQHIGLLGDLEPVKRRGEVPVRKQEGLDGGGGGRHEPSEDRHDHHQQQVQQQHTGQVDLAAQAGQGHRQQRQPHQAKQ